MRSPILQDLFAWRTRLPDQQLHQGLHSRRPESWLRFASSPRTRSAHLGQIRQGFRRIHLSDHLHSSQASDVLRGEIVRMHCIAGLSL